MNTATRSIARMILGKDIITSTTRWLNRSTRPPRYPLSIPQVNPTQSPAKTEIQATISVIRTPWIRRLRTSRARESVPIRCAVEGAIIVSP